MCVCVLSGGHVSPSHCFGAHKLKQLWTVKRQPCVIAEPWEERAGQAMGFVRTLTECVCALCGM